MPLSTTAPSAHPPKPPRRWSYFARLLSGLILLVILATACSGPAVPTAAPSPTPTALEPTSTRPPSTPTLAPTATQQPTATAVQPPTPTAQAAPTGDLVAAGEDIQIPDDIKALFKHPLKIEIGGTYALYAVQSGIDLLVNKELVPGYQAVGFRRLEYTRPDGVDDYIFIPLAINAADRVWIICCAAQEKMVDINHYILEGTLPKLCSEGKRGVLVILFKTPDEETRHFQSLGFPDPIIEALYPPGTLEEFAKTGDSSLLPDRILIPIDINFQNGYNE